MLAIWSKQDLPALNKAPRQSKIYILYKSICVQEMWVPLFKICSKELEWLEPSLQVHQKTLKRTFKLLESSRPVLLYIINAVQVWALFLFALSQNVLLSLIYLGSGEKLVFHFQFYHILLNL